MDRLVMGKAGGRSAWLVTIGEPLIGEAEKRAPLRTGQMAMHLRDAGWDVTWWTSGFDHFRKKRFTSDERAAAEATGIRIEWLEGVDYRRNISFARAWNHLQMAREFTRRAATLRPPDVIDLGFPPIELAGAVSKFARDRNIPFLVDVRDLWPDVFVWAAPVSARPVARVALLPLEAAVRRSLGRADAIVGVSDGYLEWGLRHAGRARNAFDAVIPIFGPPLRDRAEQPRLVAGLDPRKIVFAFVGSFARSYDLRTVIAAAALMPEELRDTVQIVLAGDGEDAAELRQRASGLPHILMPGWLGREEGAGLMSAASAGLAAYAPGALQSLPNKIVDYLSFGLPIVSALEGECATLLSRTGAGWNYMPGNAASLAETLVRLARNPAEVTAAATRARELFVADFEPNRSRRRYADLLQNLADQGRPRGNAS